MRRFLIFLLALTIPIGLLSGTHKGISALADDVTLTETVEYGDPAAVNGLRLQLQTMCDYTMIWQTDHTCGQPGQTETEFTFVPEGEDNEIQTGIREDFSLFAHTGIGASTSGGDGFRFGEDGIDALLNAVAQRAPANSVAYREELVLSDYTDYYHLSYVATLFRGSYAIDEIGGSVGEGDPDPSIQGAYPHWTQLFRFPVQEGSRVSVEITKDTDGAVRDFSFNMLNNPQIYFVHAFGEEGLYFAPVFTDDAGNVLQSGEYPEGYGLYYVPYRYTEQEVLYRNGGNGYYHATFDFENLRLLRPMSSNSLVISLQAEEERDVLHAVTWEDGSCRYNALRLSDSMLLSSIEVTQCTAAEVSQKLFPEEGKLVLQGSGWLALVDIRAPKLDFVCRLPENWHLGMPDDILYRDGTLYMTALEWVEAGQGFYLAACAPEGLGYCGSWISNLTDRHTTSNSKGYIRPTRIRITD